MNNKPIPTKTPAPHATSPGCSAKGSAIAGLKVRQTAARLLGAVIDKKTSLCALVDNEHGNPQYLQLDNRDRSLCRAILSAALRHRGSINAQLALYLKKPLPDKARSLQHLLHISAAQILYLNTPDHAAIDLAVTAAKHDARNIRFASLINAVLRQLTRHKQQPLKTASSLSYVPEWFSNLLISSYGHSQAEDIVKIQAQEPAIDLTVKQKPQHWAKTLGGIVLANGTVRLNKLDQPVESLQGFDEGAWWVQDVAAAIPARLMGDIRHKKVADLCAAPGGKTAQLALQKAQVTAIDLSANRLKRLTTNMKRLGLAINIWSGHLKDYPDTESFDAVLLDAPCSSTGTIRRHPDVLWTKNSDDIDKMAELQYDLLNAAIRLVKSQGTIMFSNCSLATQEGEMLIERLLNSRSDIALSPFSPQELPQMEKLIKPQGFLRTTPADLPHDNIRLAGMDGFFAARLIKQ